MAQRTLEERVAALEQQVAELQAAFANGARVKDWRRTIGMFTDDPGMQEIFKEAMKLREEDRARGSPSVWEQSAVQVMIILDTDHLSGVTDRRDSRYAILMERLHASKELPVVTTIVSV